MSSEAETPGRLGIIAGSGPLPGLAAAAERDRGADPFMVALHGITDPAVAERGPHQWVALGQAQATLDALHDAGCARVILAGPVPRPSFRDLSLDSRGWRLVMRLGLAAAGDDGLLGGIARELEGEGFRVCGTADVLADLLVRPGRYGGPDPDDSAAVDIRRGLDVTRALGHVDVGQAVVVQDGVVLGVEAVEGTDALIARCGPLHWPGPGGLLVKAAKPGQDTRVDLPTVGPATVDNAAAAGLRGIAVEAGGSQITDPAGLAKAADKAGIFVLGVDTTGAW